MIVIDTSAMVSALAGGPEAARFQSIIKDAPAACMSAFNVFECRVVLVRRFGAGMLAEFELLLREAEIAIEPFDADQARLAFEAYRRFGKGTGHAAGLNLGDCAAYALARSRDLPLLYKGQDFAKTDLRPAP